MEAARKLGWEDIDCIYVDLDEIDRQLWEIDENLCRADLSPAELAQHLKRRKELWGERHKEKGGPTCPTPGGEQKIGFAKDTEEKTGTPKRTTNRAVSRGEAIPADVLSKIEGTELDKGTYLDKLKTLSHNEQREKVAGCNMTPSQRAAVTVEQASFYPRGKPKENYKRENSPLTDIAQANGVDRKMIVWAKAVWDAAGTVPIQLCRPVRKTPLKPGQKSRLISKCREGRIICAINDWFSHTPCPYRKTRAASAETLTTL